MKNAKCKQLSIYFNELFSKYQCGFRKGFSVEHYLLAMLERWGNSMHQGKYFEALLADLLKAFDCLPHDLLTTKLSAYYGFDNNSIRFLFNYLTNRKNRTKIGQV